MVSLEEKFDRWSKGLSFKKRYVIVFTLSAIAIGAILFVIEIIFTTFSIPRPDNLDALVIEVGIGVVITSIIFHYSSKQDERLNNFAKEQEEIKKRKRERYSTGILFTLNLIDFEVEGLFTFARFLEISTSESEKLEKKKILLNKYDKIQSLFMNMKIEYDTMLEVFNPQLDEQYIKTSQNIRVAKDIWQYTLDNITTLKTEIEKIRKEFEVFKDQLLPFSSPDSRTKSAKLFNLDKIKEIISQISPSSQDNNQQD